jgi:ergothioneine biosynthesis protein EgtB
VTLDTNPTIPTLVDVAHSSFTSWAEDALRSYREIRDATELLARSLSPEDQTVQSMPDVSPTKWHRAHTTWFFETFLLQPLAKGYDTFHDKYGFLFNSYYEAVGPRHPRTSRGDISRPGVAEIAEYREYVDAACDRLLRSELSGATRELVELGFNHEQQHQELILMDIKHVLSRNPLLPAYHQPLHRVAGSTPAMKWHRIEGGIVSIGHGGEGFSFDNERPEHADYVATFEIADRPVTCGDFMAFIEDRGYERPELWLSDGWAAVVNQEWEAPLYWRRGDDAWSIFTLGGERAIDPAEPVCHISYYEADAYARYVDARLPTEEEWETARPTVGDNRLFNPFDIHPRPVGENGGAGQVWEWTASAYLPYPGFRIAEGAVGEYNGKFMVGQHVLRGGCVATPQNHWRPTYRNFFPPGARWAFSGVRLARDVDEASGG